jgi:hypothetical protein
MFLFPPKAQAVSREHQAGNNSSSGNNTLEKRPQNFQLFLPGNGT